MTDEGGRCPSCGAAYPRTIPADQDQRCWTCWLANEPTKPGGVMTPLELDAIRQQAARYAAAIGPGGEKAWLAGQLAGHVPALLAEVERLRAEVDQAYGQGRDDEAAGLPMILPGWRRD